MDNSGSKLKAVAWILFAVSALASVIAGFCLARPHYWDYGEFNILLFLSVGGGGVFFSYVSALLISGFGELIENSKDTRYYTNTIMSILRDNNESKK